MGYGNGGTGYSDFAPGDYSSNMPDWYTNAMNQENKGDATSYNAQERTDMLGFGDILQSLAAQYGKYGVSSPLASSPVQPPF